MTDKDDKYPQSAVERLEAYRREYEATGDPRKAIRAYCGNNVHLIENAKAVGNWPTD